MNATPVYPKGRHTQTLDCWCGPSYWKVCAECEEHDEAPRSCWKCQGKGLIRVDREEAETTDDPLVIVHTCDICKHNDCICPENLEEKAKRERQS